MPPPSTPSGGLTVSPEMSAILAKPGLLTVEQGGQDLRDMYRKEISNLNVFLLAPFAMTVFIGHLDLVQAAIENGSAPALSSTETPFQLSYASLLILGSQRYKRGPVGSGRHLETLTYMFAHGLPKIALPDLLGYTALHHATSSPYATDALTRCLISNGADVNARNRFGEIPLLAAMQLNLISTIDILMENGASLDIPEADGWTARRHYIACGPQVTAAVSRWIRRRAGEEAPLSRKCCDTCNKAPSPGEPLKACAQCRIARYCSQPCQKTAWPAHKRTCTPFTPANTVTLTPHYKTYSWSLPTAELTRTALGYPTRAAAWSESKRRTSAMPAQFEVDPDLDADSTRRGKNIIIKVQVPFVPDTVYDRRRAFACAIRRQDEPGAYDALVEVVHQRGVGGAKAYLSAVLERKDRLVVKISEVLAEQPW
ncbi:hypothetical protein MKEN_01016000 [Mycena kentingensis (nom. inval.)]|nr:hypothetical protein MKEN_01016000 [Mycena kentingensis (nom. inval.)]